MIAPCSPVSPRASQSRKKPSIFSLTPPTACTSPNWLIEPVIAYRSAIHVTLPVIIGAGGAVYETYESRLGRPNGPTRYNTGDAQAFFVIEPGIALELSMIKLVRLGLGVSYRYTSDITLPETPKDALRGFNAGVTLKIGRF